MNNASRNNGVLAEELTRSGSSSRSASCCCVMSRSYSLLMADRSGLYVLNSSIRYSNISRWAWVVCVYVCVCVCVCGERERREDSVTGEGALGVPCHILAISVHVARMVGNQVAAAPCADKTPVALRTWAWEQWVPSPVVVAVRERSDQREEGEHWVCRIACFTTKPKHCIRYKESQPS